MIVELLGLRQFGQRRMQDGKHGKHTIWRLDGLVRIMTDLELVKNDGMALKFIEHQTDEMCVLAITNNTYSLEFVKNQTEAMCLFAVSINGSVLPLVRKQTDKICMEAVRMDSVSLKHVKNQTYEICECACRYEPSYRVYIRDIDMRFLVSL